MLTYSHGDCPDQVEEATVADPIGWLDTTPPRRLLRAGALAVAMTAVGVAAHLVAGGSWSGAGAVVSVALLIGPAWLLTGRERGWTAIAGAQLAGQEAVHLLHVLLTGAGHAHNVPAEMMLYGHVAVAALLAAWLRHGERRLWHVARRAARALATRWRALTALFDRPPPTRPAAGPAAPQRSVPAGQALRHCVVRRGPPLPAR